jgi:hypothetical protein
MARPPICRPLNKSKQEIRLNEVHSGNPENGKAESYSLVHSSLLDQSLFSALSYVWGDPSITEDILLDGVKFPVTVNLAAALKHAKVHWTTYFPDQDRKIFRL